MMKNRIGRRLLAGLLVMCMAAVAISSALAAVPASMIAQVQGDGFTVTPLDVVARAAYTSGIATATFTNSSGQVFSGDVYAAIQPTSGGAVRYVSATLNAEGKYEARYQQAGQLEFNAVLVQPVLDGGTVRISTNVSGINASGQRTIAYTASLDMSREIAELAAWGAGTSWMDGMQFTCYIVAPETSGLDIQVTGTALNDVFEWDGQISPPVNGVYSIPLTLKQSWYSGLTLEQRVSKLMQKMSVTASVTVSDANLSSHLAGGTLYNHGWIEMTYRDENGQAASIPGTVGLQKIVVPANLSETIVDPNAVEPTIPPETTPPTVEPTLPVEPTPPASNPPTEPTTPVVPNPPPVLVSDDHIVYMVGDDQGNFRPNANITRAEVAMIFYRLLADQNVTATVTFDDVSSDAWYKDAVNALAALGIIKGVGNGKFAPDRQITRAEFVTIAARFTKDSPDETVSFPDVAPDYWAYQEIVTATVLGWVVGDDQGNFRPNDNIVRAETATIVNRMLGRLGDHNAIDNGLALNFPDVLNTHWAYYDICEATTSHKHSMNNDKTQETWEIES